MQTANTFNALPNRLLNVQEESSLAEAFGEKVALKK